MKHTVEVGGEKVRFEPPKVVSPLPTSALSNPSEAWQRYRRAEIDPRVREVPAAIQAGIKTDPDRYLPELSAFLVDDADDDFHAVKRLHDWVADNISYDTESYFSGTIERSSTGLASVFETGSSVCSGYANVFQAMAEAAGFETERVSGYARGYSYDAFGSEDSSKSNHAWNAVQIQGEYYLVDTTWNSGHVNRSDGFIKAYSTRYLFIPPAAFIHRHFPAEEAWQLLDEPLSQEDFAALPYLKGRFFAAGLELQTPLERINHVGSTTRIRVAYPEETVAFWTLRSSNGTKQLDRIRVQETEDGEDLLVIFPAPGDWMVSVFVKPKESSGTYWKAAEFAFNASEGSPIRFTD